MWAKKAVPPPDCGARSDSPPDQICRPIQMPRNQNAWISRIRMIPKKISVSTRARGSSTKYAPSTPAIAPLAPMFGMLASSVLPNPSVIADCTAIAAMPAARYQKTKRSGPIASSTLLPKIHRKSMFPTMCSQLACMNMPVKTPSYHGSGCTANWTGTWHGPSIVHG